MNCNADSPQKGEWPQIEKDLTKSLRGKDVLQQFKDLDILLSEIGGMSFVKSFGMSFFSGFLNFPQNGTCQNNKGNIADATCQEIIDMIGIKNLGRYVVFNLN